VKNEPAKQPISNDPRRELRDPVALLLEHERRLSFIRKSVDRGRRPRLIQPRQLRLVLVYAYRYDAVEICCGYRPDCGLCPAGNAALFIQHASLYETVWSAERKGIDEVEIVMSRCFAVAGRSACHCTQAAEPVAAFHCAIARIR
jgi:hypothetical protein